LTSKSLLVTRPNYDLATTYLFHWSKLVIQLAKKKGFSVIDLSADKANSYDFASRLNKRNPLLVFLNGHGSDSSVLGQDGKVLVSVSKRILLLKGKIIYARSCSSAKTLGPKSIIQGAQAFIGYREPFIFMHEARFADPLADKTAALFLKPSNKVMISLLKGHSALEADRRSKKDYQRNIRKLLTSETRKKDAQTLRYLYWNMRHQVCLVE